MLASQPATDRLVFCQGRRRFPFLKWYFLSGWLDVHARTEMVEEGQTEIRGSRDRLPVSNTDGASDFMMHRPYGLIDRLEL